MDGIEPSLAEFKLCDYKSKTGGEIPLARRDQLKMMQTTVPNVLVVMVGGGSLYEHSTLTEIGGGRRVLYCCDELLSPGGHLTRLIA